MAKNLIVVGANDILDLLAGVGEKIRAPFTGSAGYQSTEDNKEGGFGGIGCSAFPFRRFGW
jgi:hypothetical protein